MQAPPGVRRIGGVASKASAALASAYRISVTTGRWLVLAAWVLGTALLTLLTPGGGSGGTFGELLPEDHSVIRVQERILEEFRVPVLSGTTLVVHQPGGMGHLTRADSVLWALATTQRNVEGRVPDEPGHIIAAIPVPTGAGDTAVTYLYVSEGTGLHKTVRLAEDYAAHFHNQSSVETYVTGFVPATVAQIHYLGSYIKLFEAASGLLIVLVVAVAFRSMLAPLVVLGIAAIGYLVYTPLLAAAAGALGFQVPGQLEPVLLALLLGLVTDYCVLLFSAFRDELDVGTETGRAVRRALQRDAPIIAVAGLCVAGGTIALVASPFEIFAGLGPALALTVLVSLAACLTLTPAVMAILGWRLFTVLPVKGSRMQHGEALETLSAEELQQRAGRGIRLLTARGPALAASVGVVVLLGMASLPLAHARLDLSATAGLPGDDAVAQGAQLLADAGVRGLSAPTEVFVEQEGITAQRSSLSRLERLISRQPGVVRVLGPADSPGEREEGLVLAESGNAARFVVVYNTDPLAAGAIAHVRHLQSRLPALVDRAGLPDARVSVTGQTVIASEVAALTRRSLEITVLVALGVELLILILYLRAIVAPVVLLASSVLSVTAALGLTTLVFQDFFADLGLTFYAPFAAAVLLIALGSDYNVFAVGSVWHEASRRPLTEALTVAVPRTAKAITIAGVILAGTFALVAIIPLTTFRQIAFAMAVGMLIDTMVVRPILTPALLTLMGRAAGWPSRRITTAPRRVAGTDAAPSPISPQLPARLE